MEHKKSKVTMDVAYMKEDALLDVLVCLFVLLLSKLNQTQNVLN